MRFRYRFKGKVDSQFVIRGMLFSVGAKIDFCLDDKELEFAKQHCVDFEIIDLEKPLKVESPESVLEEKQTEIENKPMGVKVNGNKQTNKSNQRKHTNNI